jgi:hypothetical protein
MWILYIPSDQRRIHNIPVPPCPVTLVDIDTQNMNNKSCGPLQKM